MNQENITKRNEGSTKKYLIYGLPNLSTAIIMGFADFALFTLYKLGYQLNAFQIGVALALGKLTIAGSQFFLVGLATLSILNGGEESPI